MQLTADTGGPRFRTIFDDTYDRPDCRAYYRMQHALRYSSQSHAVPVFRAVLAEMMRTRGVAMPRVLDFASSYGIVTALMKHEVSAAAFFARYAGTALDGLDAAGVAAADRDWLRRLPLRRPVARFHALDIAANAIAYARATGLFDTASAEDLQHAAPSPGLAACLAEVDLVVECGSVAHLMPAALDRVLTAAAPRRPWVVTSPVRGNERAEAFAVMADHGLVVDTLGLPPFPHRRFESTAEQARAIEIARAAGHAPEGRETTGAFFAQIYVARPAQEATRVADWPVKPEITLNGVGKESP